MKNKELRPVELFILENGDKYDIITAIEKVFDFLEGRKYLEKYNDDFMTTDKEPGDDLRSYEKEILEIMKRCEMHGIPDVEAIIDVLEEFNFQKVLASPTQRT